MHEIVHRSIPRVPSRLPTPPPAGRGETDPVTSVLRHAAVRHALTLIAIALVFVVVAVLDRSIAPAGANAIPLPAIAFAGLGATAVGMLLRRAGVRP